VAQCRPLARRGGPEAADELGLATWEYRKASELGLPAEVQAVLDDWGPKVGRPARHFHDTFDHLPLNS